MVLTQLLVQLNVELRVRDLSLSRSAGAFPGRISQERRPSSTLNGCHCPAVEEAPAHHCSLQANASSCCRWLCCCHPDIRTHLLQLPMWTEDHGSAPGHHCQIATVEASTLGGFSASTVCREPLWEYSTLIGWASLINLPLHYIHMVNSAPREYWLIQISRYFPKRNEKNERCYKYKF